MWYQMYFLPYFLHLLAGAFLIVGFFAITRGTELTQPDGSIKRVGKIFKGWFFFWFKENGKIKYYYKDDELVKIIAQIRAIRPNSTIKVYYENMPGPNIVRISGIASSIVDEYFWSEIESRFNLKVEVVKTFVPENMQGSELAYMIFKLYKEEPNYVFPWYMRDMLAGCVTCHSSWLGSVCFWVPAIIGIYGSLSMLHLVMLWICYCISQAFIVTALWKKYM